MKFASLIGNKLYTEWLVYLSALSKNEWLQGNLVSRILKMLGSYSKHVHLLRLLDWTNHYTEA